MLRRFQVINFWIRNTDFGRNSLRFFIRDNGRKIFARRRALGWLAGFGGGGGTVLAASLWKRAADAGQNEADAMQRKIRAVIEKSDILYDNYLIDNVYAGLRRFESYENPEILWRLARATCELGKQSKEKTERKERIEEAFGYIQRALELEPSEGSFAIHKWYAILLNYMGDYQGMKEKIKKSVEIKDHLERAIQLNPRDATTFNILGSWHYTVADLPYYQRKVASVIFAEPPTSTFEEALKYFEKAEEIDPGFYSLNYLMLAKTYMKLGSPEKAKPILEKICTLVITSPDDFQAKEEAMELLKKV